MSRPRLRWWTGAICRITTGILMFVALIEKLTDGALTDAGALTGIRLFARRLDAQLGLGVDGSIALAWAAVGAEAVLGAWLLIHARPRLAAGFTIAFLIVSSAGLAFIYARAGNVSCGCFGRLSDSTVVGATIRNAVLAGMLAATLPSRREDR